MSNRETTLYGSMDISIMILIMIFLNYSVHLHYAQQTQPLNQYWFYTEQLSYTMYQPIGNTTRPGAGSSPRTHKS